MEYKITVLTQDVLEILLRCSPKLLSATVKEYNTETFKKRMQFAGYTPKFKGEVVTSVIVAYRKSETWTNKTFNHCADLKHGRE